MIQQFIRYSLIGVVNTGIDFGLYSILTRGFEFWHTHYLLANAVTFMTVVTWSFFLNKYWTFRNGEREHIVQYTKFVVITLVGMGIAESVLYVGVDFFSLYDLVSKVIAAPLVVTWNFFMYRFWAFAGQETRPETVLS